MTRRVAFVGVLALIGTMVTGTAASAGTTSPDELAERYGLVQTADLPNGYELDALRRETGGTAYALDVVGDCATVSTDSPYVGDSPVTAQATFEEESVGGARAGQGRQTVYEFEDVTDAKAYFKKMATGIKELIACETMVDGIGNIGTYDTLDVGRVGDQRIAMTFDPRADRYTRVGVVRQDEAVTYVEMYDDDLTDAEFAALVKGADRRMR